jgi:hypothetical protein
MVEHSAYGMMPVGEANDGVTGLFVSASTPDIYEYAGMVSKIYICIYVCILSFINLKYVWTVLFVQGKAWSMSPLGWSRVN